MGVTAFSTPSGGRRIVGWILDHLVGSVVGTLITAGLLVRVIPPTWQWWVTLPLWAKLSLGVAVSVGVLAAWRFAHLRRLDRAVIFVNRPPREWGYDFAGYFNHGRVVWEVARAHEGYSRDNPFEKPEAELERIKRSLDISEPPLCPRCRVRLAQKRRFWGSGFRWTCPGCDFRVTSPMSWSASAQVALDDLRGNLKALLEKEQASQRR